MEWAGNSQELVLERLNRLQNTNDVFLAGAGTGAVDLIYRDRDTAWVDAVEDLRWLHNGKELLWVSEQDGWRHAYAVSCQERHARLITPGAFDVISVVAIDPKEEWLCYLASPDNATERYLYRAPLDRAVFPDD